LKISPDQRTFQPREERQFWRRVFSEIFRNDLQSLVIYLLTLPHEHIKSSREHRPIVSLEQFGREVGKVHRIYGIVFNSKLRELGLGDEDRVGARRGCKLVTFAFCKFNGSPQRAAVI